VTLKVSAKEVGELRKASGAGMMDCKRALAANDGDLEKSKDYLRKKGLASADKKAGRVASEGVVASYIHGPRYTPPPPPFPFPQQEIAIGKFCMVPLICAN
jgi:translation elongation factor EF-Ts